MDTGTATCHPKDTFDDDGDDDSGCDDGDDDNVDDDDDGVNIDVDADDTDSDNINFGNDGNDVDVVVDDDVDVNDDVSYEPFLAVGSSIVSKLDKGIVMCNPGVGLIEVSVIRGVGFKTLILGPLTTFTDDDSYICAVLVEGNPVVDASDLCHINDSVICDDV